MRQRVRSAMILFGDSNEADALRVATLAAQAGAVGLRYVSDTQPGIRRLRRGREFCYIAPDNRAISDEAELRRIALLAIPPAYTDVWICLHPDGHLQATGFDSRKRKQYRYHSAWRAARDDIKFGRMAEFGKALPRLRLCLQKDMRQRGLPQKKVVAAIVSLLDTTRVRIGSLSYARDNHTFGLTTLRKSHLAHSSERYMVLKFRGKSEVEHEVRIDSKPIVKVIRACQQLRGKQLFQYLDNGGKRHSVGAEHVNSYLHEAMGADFTAKDFRTWGATLRAFELMMATPFPQLPSNRALKACIAAATRKVAEELRNTPAVCRKSYINPRVFSAWQKGILRDCPGETAATENVGLESMMLALLHA